MKESKGITLVALIITIIVMLILVAVTVSILINSNVIGQAKSAGERTEKAYNNESNFGESLTINVDGKSYGSIDDYLNNREQVEEIHNWVRGTTSETRDNLTCTCDVCTNDGENPAGRTVVIGQRLEYTAGGSASTTISAEKSGVAQAKTDNQSWASSYGDSQTINKDATTNWVVLGAEDTNGNNTNETLLLTTETPTTSTITLYGAAGYNNWATVENTEGEADRIAKALYGNNARGMTIEDVNNCLDYTPAGGMYQTNTSYQPTCGTTGNLTTKLSELPIWNTTSGIGTTTATPDGSTLEDNELNGYFYKASEITGTDREKWLIFGSLDNYVYWLASRGVFAYPGYAVFGPGFVYRGVACSYYDLFYSSGGFASYDEFTFRAVVSLTSEIPAVSATQPTISYGS